MTIPNIPWDEYKSIINSANNSLNKEVVVWRKFTPIFDRYGEDSTQDNFSDINLEVLIQYNYFRTWPIADESLSGNIDSQSMTMFINIAYLQANNWLNNEGNFDLNQEMDRFQHMGFTYMCKGMTPVAQASDEPLLIMVNLQREEKENK